MIAMAYPLNNAFSSQGLLALAEAGMLEEYWTSLNWKRGGWWDRVLPSVLTRELRRRSLPVSAGNGARIRTKPGREAGRLLSARLPGGRWLTRHEAGPFCVDQVFQTFDRRVARRLPELKGVRGVYAFEDGALATFAEAGRQGMKRIYDLPIGYWRAGREIYEEEARREPRWAATLTGREDSTGKLERKDLELEQADAIITASTFTRQTLSLAKNVRCPIHIVPYGAPPALAVLPDHAPATSGKLRVLFAGSLGQRKGLSYLLAAVERLGSRVELTLLGSKTVEGCAALDAAVRAHRWIPSLPHAEFLAEMERQDVLVFPSLFEGFGLVILEAMSRGVPVIATAHTAAPDLYTDGSEGFIVPIRSADAIVEKLEILLLDPARLRAMKAAALARAATHRWENYRRGLVAAIRQTLGDAPPCP